MLLYDQIDSTNDKPVRPETRIAVKRALADAVLTLSARVVMGYLLMDHPQAVKRQKCPPLYVTAAALGLCTRTVQRAYDELERAGWLDDSRTGPDDLPDAGEEPERRRLLHQLPGEPPPRRAPPASLPPPTLDQHIEGFEVLRERALAANKLGIALRAHIELGHSMGYARPRRSSLLASGEAARAADEAKTLRQDAAADAVPLNRRSAPPSPQGRWESDGQEPADTGAEPAPMGSELAKAGSNWHELAGSGRPEAPADAADSGYFLKQVKDLARKPPSDSLRADAEWENFCRSRNAERVKMGLAPDMAIDEDLPAPCPLQLPAAPETDKFSTLDRRGLAVATPGAI